MWDLTVAAGTNGRSLIVLLWKVNKYRSCKNLKSFLPMKFVYFKISVFGSFKKQTPCVVHVPGLMWFGFLTVLLSQHDCDIWWRVWTCLSCFTTFSCSPFFVFRGENVEAARQNKFSTQVLCCTYLTTRFRFLEGWWSLT